MVAFYPLQPYRPAVTHAEAITTQAFEKPLEADYPTIAPTPDYSFQHVLQPERFTIRQLPEEERLSIARKELEGFIEQQLLVKEQQPVAYVYYICAGSRTHTGIVGGLDGKDYDSGAIKQHEKTHQPKRDALLRFFDEVGVNATPVLVAHQEDKVLEAIKAEIMQTVKLYNFTTKDGTQHAVWRITDQQQLDNLRQSFACLPALYIADGHHRCATLSALAQRKAAGHKPEPPIMAYCLPASALNIHGYHRVLHNLPVDDIGKFLKALEKLFIIEPLTEPALPNREGELVVYLKEKWYRWTVRSKVYDTEKLHARLDVYILDQLVLKAILGIDVDQTDQNLRFIEGTIRMDGLMRKTNEENCEGIFLLHPISVETLMRIADAQETLPPKSTWIEPKLRSGLFVQPL